MWMYGSVCGCVSGCVDLLLCVSVNGWVCVWEFEGLWVIVSIGTSGVSVRRSYVVQNFLWMSCSMLSVVVVSFCLIFVRL